MAGTTPLARAVRTFAHGMTGVLSAAVVANWVSDYHAAAVALALGTVTALVAAVAAYLLAVGGATASSAIGKAVATTAQFIGAGIATVTLADLTTDAVNSFGLALLRIAISGVAAGLVTLAVNASETSGA
jgi:uncharacterized membrane protein